MVKTSNPASSLCRFLLALWTDSTPQSLKHTSISAAVAFLPLLFPVLFVQTHFLRSSAKLEPGGGLNGIQQFVPHQVLVAELRQLEQVHASAGGGQALQVAAAVVDAEDRVKLLCHPKKTQTKKTFKIKKLIGCSGGDTRRF